MYASRTRKEKFSDRGENCQRNVTDLAGSLVASSRPPGRLQKRPREVIPTKWRSYRSHRYRDVSSLYVYSVRSRTGRVCRDKFCTFVFTALHIDSMKNRSPSCTIRYDAIRYFNVRSKADMSRLNLPHGDDN